MTYPEDRVLVGVINRKRDLETARNAHWYRIPEARLKRGFHADYLAFFLSRAFKEQNGGIHYYAEVKGYELVYRRWLLPDQPDHPRADEKYYKVALGDLIQKQPPVLNPTRRTITFVFTTWDRFIHAHEISHLYSQADYYVDRVYNALRREGYRPNRLWEVENRLSRYAPGLQFETNRGPMYVSVNEVDDALYMNLNESQDSLIASIRQALEERDSPADINTPLDHD